MLPFLLPLLYQSASRCEEVNWSSPDALQAAFEADDRRRRVQALLALASACTRLAATDGAPPTVRLVAWQMRPHLLPGLTVRQRVLTATAGWVFEHKNTKDRFFVSTTGTVFRLDADGVLPGTYTAGPVPVPVQVRSQQVGWWVLDPILTHVQALLDDLAPKMAPSAARPWRRRVAAWLG